MYLQLLNIKIKTRGIYLQHLDELGFNYCYFSWTKWVRKRLDKDQSFFVGAQQKSAHLFTSSSYSIIRVLQWNCRRYWQNQQNENSRQNKGNHFTFLSITWYLTLGCYCFVCVLSCFIFFVFYLFVCLFIDLTKRLTTISEKEQR